MTTQTVAPPWRAEGRYPTPDEALTWLTDPDPTTWPARLAYIRGVLAADQAPSRYRLAWFSARRRARDLSSSVRLVLDETRETVSWDTTSDPAEDLRAATHAWDLTAHSRLVDSARKQGRDVSPSWLCLIHTKLVHTDGPCPDTPAPQPPPVAPFPHDTDLVLVATLTPNRPIAPCARYDHQTSRTDFVHTLGPCPDNQAPR